MIQPVLADEAQQAAVVAKAKKAEAAQRTASTLLARGKLPAVLIMLAVRDGDDWQDGEGRDEDKSQRIVMSITMMTMMVIRRSRSRMSLS